MVKEEKKTDVEVQVVMNRDGTIRCIYLNNFRIIGGKPYVSENLAYKTFTVSLDDMLSAGFRPGHRRFKD